MDTEDTAITIPREEIAALVAACIKDIGDEYRAPGCEDDDEPSMQLTVGIDDEGSSWNYQTGDNSFAGGAYGMPHWAVVTLTRGDDVDAIVDEVFSQWEDALCY